MIATIKDGVLTMEPETISERTELIAWCNGFQLQDGSIGLEVIFPPILKLSDDGMYLVCKDDTRWQGDDN